MNNIPELPFLKSLKSLFLSINRNFIEEINNNIVAVRRTVSPDAYAIPSGACRSLNSTLTNVKRAANIPNIPINSFFISDVSFLNLSSSFFVFLSISSEALRILSLSSL